MSAPVAPPSDSTPGDRGWLLAAAIWVALFHVPSIGAGFVSDDAVASLDAGEARVRGVGVLELAAEGVVSAIAEGRFNPVSSTTQLHYSLFPTRMAHQSIKIIVLLAVIGLWGIVVRRLSGCVATALLTMVLTGVALQYRFHPDAVLGSSWQLPQAMASFLGGVLLQLEADRREDRRLGIASAALFSLAVLTDAMVLPLGAVHVALALPGRTRAAAARRIAPHVVAASGLVAILLVVRAVADAPSAIRPMPIAMVLLMLQQAWAAVPLSAAIADGAIVEARVLLPSGVAVLLAAAALVLAGRARARIGPLAPDASRRLVVVATLIWLLSSATISVSEAHQRETVWGMGQLPVLVGAFGAAALLAHGVVAGLRALPNRAAQWAVLGLLAPLVTIGYQRNASVADALATQWRHPREALADGLEAGVLDAADVRSGVWVQSWGEGPPPWERPALFALHAGASPRAVWSGELPPERMGSAERLVEGALRRLPARLAYVTYGAATEGSGLAVAGVASHVTLHLPPRPVAPSARIFLRRPALGDEGRGSFGYFPPLPHGARLFFDEFGPDGQVVARAMWIERGEHGPGLALRRSGDGWELWELEATPEHGLALHTVRVAILPN